MLLCSCRTTSKDILFLDERISLLNRNINEIEKQTDQLKNFSAAQEVKKNSLMKETNEQKRAIENLRLELHQINQNIYVSPKEISALDERLSSIEMNDSAIRKSVRDLIVMKDIPTPDSIIEQDLSPRQKTYSHVDKTKKKAEISDVIKPKKFGPTKETEDYYAIKAVEKARQEESARKKALGEERLKEEAKQKTLENKQGYKVTSKITKPTVKPSVTTSYLVNFSIDFGSYHCLIIGNNKYRSLPKLRTAVNDAQAMATLLHNNYGFNINLLTNATRADILKAIHRYRQKLGHQDNLIIYYAGHGWLDKDADQGYWLPIDAERQDITNWISNSSITDEIKAMEAKHVLVISDSCYSGKLVRGINIQIRNPNYYEKICKKKARTVMASGGLEPVVDQGGKGNHSVFASALIDALNENQGIIDASSLFSQIRRSVMLNTDQTPEYSDMRKAGHDGGDFLFVRITKQ